MRPDFTPSNENLRYAWREVRGDRSLDEADAEFERWIAAHDQGIRDAVRPAEMTAKEHLEAAFEAAFPVPDGRDVPTGVPLIARWEDGDISFHATGLAPGTSVPNDHVEVRTLDPLPPLIPEGTPAVWASTSDGILVRRILVNTDHITRQWIDMYDTKYTDEQLIDPAPIPEEER